MESTSSIMFGQHILSTGGCLSYQDLEEYSSRNLEVIVQSHDFPYLHISRAGSESWTGISFVVNIWYLGTYLNRYFSDRILP